MQTDTTTLAPTDAEIDAAYRKVWSTIPHAQRLSAFAHEIASTLAARWGAPAPASFPVRITALLRDVADRNGTETKGPWEDVFGEPLQDDADAALAWIAAPPAQEARVPLTSEQQRCIAEAHNVAACEEYFNARPQIDYIANRRIFEAGFSKGYGITAAQKETP